MNRRRMEKKRWKRDETGRLRQRGLAASEKAIVGLGQYRLLSKRLQRLGLSYRAYLASPHWRDTRMRFFGSEYAARTVQGELCCELCRASNVRLSVHHRIYDRLGKEWLADLVSVCDRCHRAIHGKGDVA